MQIRKARGVVYSSFIGAFIVVGFSVTALKFDPLIRENTKIGGIDVGGLSIPDAEKKIRIWWEAEKTIPLDISVKDFPNAHLKPLTAKQMGVVVDDVASVEKAPTVGLVGSAEQAVAGKPAASELPLKFKLSGGSTADLDKDIHEFVPAPKPASVKWLRGQGLVKFPECPPGHLDVAQLPAAVGMAFTNNLTVNLPFVVAQRMISDADLDQITDLISSFTTHFPGRQFDRNNNIKLAAAKLNGVVLAPGERLSFNQTVGKRTIQGGFKVAPVYKNGKHDHGVGGGICQVSSTLYNAALLGGIKIVARQNHSLPVAYVKLGRDATVDYGQIDLVLENNYPTPIAVTSEFEQGQLSFRIFGKPKPDLKIVIERSPLTVTPAPIQFVDNPRLAPGQTRVTDYGKPSMMIKTWRLVYQDGKLIQKEFLGTSRYKSMPRIIERGPAVGSPQIGAAPGQTGFKPQY